MISRERAMSIANNYHRNECGTLHAFASTGIIRDRDELSMYVAGMFLECETRTQEKELMSLMAYIDLSPEYTGPKLVYARAA